MQEPPFHRRLCSFSATLFWLGAAMVVLAFGALALPVIFSMVAAVLAAWMFLTSGIVLLLGSLSIRGTATFFAAALSSLPAIAAGIFLLANPRAGAGILTLILFTIFVLHGAFKVFFAFEMFPLRGWRGMLLSGIASLFIAALIAAGWPRISVFALGFILGINFFSTGLGYMSVSWALAQNRIS